MMQKAYPALPAPLLRGVVAVGGLAVGGLAVAVKAGDFGLRPLPFAAGALAATAAIVFYARDPALPAANSAAPAQRAGDACAGADRVRAVLPESRRLAP